MSGSLGGVMRGLGDTARRLSIASLVLAAAAVVLAVAAPTLDETVAGWVAGVGSIVLSVLVAANLAWRIRRLTPSERDAWSSVAVGLAAWTLGRVIWVYQDLRGLPIKTPGLHDVFYLVSVPVMVLGLFRLPQVPVGKFERWRIWSDAAITGSATAVLLWALFVAPGSPTGVGAGRLINWVYPVADVIGLVALTLLALRASVYRRNLRLLMVSASLALWAVAHIAYAEMWERGTYRLGGWVDSVWLVGLGGFAIAAALMGFDLTRRPVTERPTSRAALMIPAVAVAALALLTVVDAVGASTVSVSSLLQLSLAGVGFLTAGRQYFAMRAAQEQLERSRDGLIATISHELRTPLTAIAGFSSMLAEQRSLEGEALELAGHIADQSEVMTRIVTDLIAVARGTTQGFGITPQRVSVRAALDSARVAAPRPSIVHLVTPEHLEIDIDPVRLQQALSNLLVNADRYGAGTIDLVARETPEGVAIEVHDNGPGVPSRFQESIWDEFERGPLSLTATVPGLGLGLAVVRLIVAGHGGLVGYRTSERLRGACFTMEFPVRVNAIATSGGDATAGI